MADIYDVQNILAGLAQDAVYPNGLSEPSVANVPVRIYPGWPEPQSLDVDLSNSVANISIYPSNITHVTTRFEIDWVTISVNTPTITFSVVNVGLTCVVTVNGTISTPQTCMITVNGTGFHYVVQPTDSLTSITQSLAKIVPGAKVSGSNSFTIFYSQNVQGNVSVPGLTVREVAREKRIYDVTIWATNPDVRATLGNALAQTFSTTYRIQMPDFFYAQLAYGGSKESDFIEKVKCYRRDLYCIFEHAITQSEIDYTIANTKVKLITPVNVNDFVLMDGNPLLLMDGNNLSIAGK